MKLPTALPLALSIVLGSCGGGDDSGTQAGSGSGSDSAELPEFDAEATYEGKTLAEYAVGLDDLSSRVRERALRDVAHFGVDALPLRDKLREMAAGDPEDELRVASYGMLFRIEDPDAQELLRQAIGNPDAMQSERGWAELCDAAEELVPPDDLAGDLRQLVKDDPQLAEQHLLASAQGRGFGRRGRDALALAFLEAEHTDELAAALAQMLPALELGAQEKVEYVVANRERLGSQVAVQTLTGIGGEAAFAGASELLAEDASFPLQTRLDTLQGFAGRGATPLGILDAIAPLAAEPGRTEPELQRVFNALAGVATQGGAELAPRFREHLAHLATVESPNARALALVHLGGQVAAGAQPPAALETLVERLESDSEEIVLGTAIERLRTAVTNLPAEGAGGLSARLGQAMYHRSPEDPWAFAVAEGVLDTIEAGMNSGRLDAVACIEAIDDAVSRHPEHPFNREVLFWLALRGAPLQKLLGEGMPLAAACFGRLVVEEAAGSEVADRLYNSNLNYYWTATIADVDTIVAFFEPGMLAQDPELAEHEVLKYMSTLFFSNLINYERLEEEKQAFAAFVERVAIEGHPAFRSRAIHALNSAVYNTFDAPRRTGAFSFPATIAGKPARVYPTAARHASPYRPGVVATGEPDQTFLVTTNKQGNLCDVRDLSSPWAVAFFDEEAAVVDVGTTDDERFRKKRGKRVLPQLVHPSVPHALLFAPGEYELAPGDELPFDPVYLSTMRP